MSGGPVLTREPSVARTSEGIGGHIEAGSILTSPVAGLLANHFRTVNPCGNIQYYGEGQIQLQCNTRICKHRQTGTGISVV